MIRHKEVIWTLYRIMYTEQKMLTLKDLPRDFSHVRDLRGPFASMRMTDLGIVNEDELFDKLTYLKHGVREDLQEQIIISGYPDARPTMTLPDMCEAFGIT